MSCRIRSAFAVLAVAFVAPTLEAQSATTTGPRMDLARAGVSASAVSAPVAAAAVLVDVSATAPAPLPQNPALRRRGMPQMIIGGVAILGGAIIGGDVGTIISLGGLGYGIYGLYLYLN